MKKPLVSIIIPTWNTDQVTKKCVDTIINFHPKDVEIIVVDNGSVDKTKQLLSSYKKIKLISNRQNLGFSKACNIGARQATADILFFLNSDMELINSSMEKIISFLNQHQNIGIIGPKFLNPNLTPQGSVFPPQTPLNAFKEYWLSWQNSYSKYTPESINPINVWAISGGAFLIRKKLFHQVGGWNEKYFMFYEDLDLCRSIRNLGYEIVYFPYFQVVHRHGYSGKAIQDYANQWRRLIPSAKMYFGNINYLIIKYIIWSGQKLHRLF